MTALASMATLFAELPAQEVLATVWGAPWTAQMHLLSPRTSAGDVVRGWRTWGARMKPDELHGARP